MTNYKVSIRYASSLLSNAQEKNILNVISDDVDFILSTSKTSKQLSNLFQSPVVKSQLKISIIDEIFKEKVNNVTLDFLKFVIKKRREMFLINILEKFVSLKDDYLGFANVNVKTAFEFSDEQTKELKESLEEKLNKKIRINFTIDKSLIGGFIAKIDDTLHDASIKHQLDLLRKRFLQGGVSLN